eukprot:Clim_evm68s201 gene=Clim_evmTU68s201
MRKSSIRHFFHQRKKEAEVGRSLQGAHVLSVSKTDLSRNQSEDSVGSAKVSKFFGEAEATNAQSSKIGNAGMSATGDNQTRGHRSSRSWWEAERRRTQKQWEMAEQEIVNRQRTLFTLASKPDYTEGCKLMGEDEKDTILALGVVGLSLQSLSGASGIKVHEWLISLEEAIIALKEGNLEDHRDALVAFVAQTRIRMEILWTALRRTLNKELEDLFISALREIKLQVAHLITGEEGMDVVEV